MICRLARGFIGWLTGKIGVKGCCTRDGVMGLSGAGGTGLQHTLTVSQLVGGASGRCCLFWCVDVAWAYLAVVRGREVFGEVVGQVG